MVGGTASDTFDAVQGSVIRMDLRCLQVAADVLDVPSVNVCRPRHLVGVPVGVVDHPLALQGDVVSWSDTELPSGFQSLLLVHDP
jgi:hypothetical protein